MDETLVKQYSRELDVIVSAASCKEPLLAAYGMRFARKVDPELEEVAGTDGIWIRFGRRFFEEYEGMERIYTYFHLVLHGIAQHPFRFQRHTNGQGDKDLWLAICDAMVNETLNASGYSCPADSIRWSHIKELHPDLQSRPIAAWSIEVIYDLLMQNAEKNKQALGKVLSKANPDLLAESGDPVPDCLKEEMLSPKQSEARLQAWYRRAKRTSGQGGMDLSILLGELPEVKIDYGVLLKNKCMKHLQPMMVTTWKQPSRLITAGILPGRVYLPGRVRDKSFKRLGLLWDTSGSCFDTEQQEEFMANLQAIQSATNCEIKAICFDSRVTAVSTIPRHMKVMDAYKQGVFTIKGGGGTDFRPPFEEALKHDPDMILMLSDMVGEFPSEVPKQPCIFITNYTVKAPFGTTISIDGKVM